MSVYHYSPQIPLSRDHLGLLLAPMIFVLFLVPLFAGAETLPEEATADTVASSSVATSTVPETTEVVIDDVAIPIEPVAFEYVEVTGGCNEDFEGKCVVARSGPSGEFPVVFHLRDHAVLKVNGSVTYKGTTWYKVVFDEWLRYPERVKTDWYVGADKLKILEGVEGEQILDLNATSTSLVASTTKRIEVDLSEQMLYAFHNDTLFTEMEVSTGRMMSSTPIGTFTIFRKTPSRYMQGPLPELMDEQVYDLPGVPWNLYFTPDGSVIHGTYWHDNFGTKYSHGCVNTHPEDGKKLYDWAELGMAVLVRD